MAEKRKSRIKNPEQYEALREQGYSKEKSARIANAGKEASIKGGKAPKYEEWTKDELYKKAKEIGLSGISRLNKTELIERLRNH